MLPDRASNAETWEFDKLVTILLRQFKRLLSDRGVSLTDAELQAMGSAVASDQQPPAQAAVICEALATIVKESEGVLASWKLTFARSLMTDMNQMPGWETTADFLTVANEKVNAEVRISAGAALMVALGDLRYAHYLIQAVEHDYEVYGQLDVDAVIARRALLFASGIDGASSGWFVQVKAWLEKVAPYLH